MTLLTEEEAKTKWCPLARSVENGGNVPTAYNRVHWQQPSKDIGLPISAYCIGSMCMAWRVGIPATEKSYESDSSFATRTSIVPARGYCGAFGAVASSPNPS